MKQAQISLTARYVERIRNPRKRAYAIAWFNFRRGAALEPENGDCSYMAAQAVRMTIDQMLGAA
jgi:hypothetical protein